MKILLLGEYSGLHSNMQKVLREFGYDSYTIGSRNGFRGLINDLDLSSDKNGFFGRLDSATKPIRNLSKFTGYDVVQAVTYKQFHPYINRHFLNYIESNNGGLYSLHTGCSHFTKVFYEKNNPQLCIDCLKYDKKNLLCPELQNRNVIEQNLLFNLSRKIIPTQREYRDSLADSLYSSKVTKTHPYPFYDVLNMPDDINLSQYGTKSKLKVFHGLNRYGFKSTRIVEQAAKILVDSKADIELHILERMSFNDYLRAIQDYDLCIDQLFSSGYGYGALYPMSLGIPVVSGVTADTVNDLGSDVNPFFYCEPQAQSLADLLIDLSCNRQLIHEYASLGHHFIRNIHGIENVVRSYKMTWGL